MNSTDLYQIERSLWTNDPDIYHDSCGVIVVEGTLTALDGKRLLAQMDALNDVNNSFRVRRQKVCAVRRFPGRR
jgi:hypothetical protein